MSNFVSQSKLLGTKPVIYNVANFTKPAAGQPALISFDDVTTMFHEFGHALHGLFADQTYPHGVGHQHRARLRRIPVAVQRALGARSQGAGALCGELQDRRADAAGAGRQDQEGVRRSTPATNLGELLAPACSTWTGTRCRPSAGKQDVDSFEAKALATTGLDIARRAAALSLQLFPAHLGAMAMPPAITPICGPDARRRRL